MVLNVERQAASIFVRQSNKCSTSNGGMFVVQEQR